jgi:TolA-binding protein
MRLGVAVIAMAVALLVAGGTATAVPSGNGGNAQLKREKAALTAKVAKLKKQVVHLSGQLKTANMQLQTTQAALAQAKTDLQTAQNGNTTLQQQLAAAQTGVPGAISTMSPLDVWNNVLPAITRLMNSNGVRWQTSAYNSSDYKTIEYVWCGFC